MIHSLDQEVANLYFSSFCFAHLSAVTVGNVQSDLFLQVDLFKWILETLYIPRWKGPKITNLRDCVLKFLTENFRSKMTKMVPTHRPDAKAKTRSFEISMY